MICFYCRTRDVLIRVKTSLGVYVNVCQNLSRCQRRLDAMARQHDQEGQ